MLVKPAPGRQVRDPHHLARVLDPETAFELPDDPAWIRLFNFGDLVEHKPEPERPAKRKGD